MIIGIGTDIIAIPRVTDLYNRYGARFANRILTKPEYDSIMLRPSRFLPRLALAFAAKEATAKALGCGIGKDCHLHDIHIGRNEKGAPTVTLTNHALDYLTQKSADIAPNIAPHIALSLSDETDIGHAMVVIWGSFI